VQHIRRLELVAAGVLQYPPYGQPCQPLQRLGGKPSYVGLPSISVVSPCAILTSVPWLTVHAVLCVTASTRPATDGATALGVVLRQSPYARAPYGARRCEESRPRLPHYRADGARAPGHAPAATVEATAGNTANLPRFPAQLGQVGCCRKQSLAQHLRRHTGQLAQVFGILGKVPPVVPRRRSHGERCGSMIRDDGRADRSRSGGGMGGRFFFSFRATHPFAVTSRNRVGVTSSTTRVTGNRRHAVYLRRNRAAVAPRFAGAATWGGCAGRCNRRPRRATPAGRARESVAGCPG